MADKIEAVRKLVREACWKGDVAPDNLREVSEWSREELEEDYLKLVKGMNKIFNVVEKREYVHFSDGSEDKSRPLYSEGELFLKV